MNGIYVRVWKDGRSIKRQLACDGKAVEDWNYHDIWAFVRGMVDAFDVNPAQPVTFHFGDYTKTLSFAEAINLGMQCFSAAGWETQNGDRDGMYGITDGEHR